MKTPILFILAVTAAFLVTVNSCTKTVTETKEVDSTIRDTVRDTTRDSVGGVALRFLSMFPDSIADLRISTTSDGNDLAVYMQAPIGSSYLQLPPASALIYYLFIPNRLTCFDSISLPSLGAGSITTVALFDNADGSAKFALGNDSAKLQLPLAGYCYMRFANGVADYPSPTPQVYIDIDNADTSVFRQNGNDRPYGWREISPYVLIPSGNHVVNLRDSPQGNVYQSENVAFQSGSYYTAYMTGLQADGNVHFRIDPE